MGGETRTPSTILSVAEAYDQDGLVSYHNHEFMTDPRFVAAYRRGVAAAGQDYRWHWRVHIGLWAAETAVRLNGDFVECGVNWGFLSSSIMQRLDWDRLGRQFYLLDTFSGLDPHSLSPEDLAADVLAKNEARVQSGFYATQSAAVRQNFAEWRNVTIVEGPVPSTLTQVPSTRVAFLHIDMNCAAPEVAALEFFWPRLVTGALVLLDDYAYNGYEHQKEAMDLAATRLGTCIASLPTGQGLIVRT